MKIKYITKSVLALAFFTSVVSCTKELDIEPRQNISAETALSSPADVQNALVGAYAVMGGPSLYGTNLVMIPDLYAGDGFLALSVQHVVPAGHQSAQEENRIRAPSACSGLQPS